MVVAFRRIWGSRKEINTSEKDSDNEAPSYVVSTHGKEVQLTPKSSAKAVRSHTTPGTDHTTTTTNNHMNKANRVLGKDLDDSLGQDKDLAKAEAVRNHDLFNLYFVGLIVLLDYYILYHSTEWSKLGTPRQDDNSSHLSDSSHISDLHNKSCHNAPLIVCHNTPLVICYNTLLVICHNISTVLICRNLPSPPLP